MAVVTSITRSHNHNQNQKRILSRNKGVKIKASVNCKMEIPALNFPTSTGISIGSLTGVMSEKAPSNIIFETPAQIASKKDKDSRKKVSAPGNNTTAYRKSMRLLIRNSNTLAEKYSSGVPYPFEMPRTVELFNSDPTKIGSERLKVLYMAGLGLYRRPDEFGMGYQRQLLQDEYDKFVDSKLDEDSDYSSIEATNPSPIPTNNANSETTSTIKTTIKTDEVNKLKWKVGSSKSNSNWDVNMTVVITPVSQNTNNEFSQSSSAEANLENDLETGTSDCNTSSNGDTDDDDWQSFGNYIEAQLRDEIIVNPKYSNREIEEAKIKIANMTKEWDIFLKGP